MESTYYSDEVDKKLVYHLIDSVCESHDLKLRDKNIVNRVEINGEIGVNIFVKIDGDEFLVIHLDSSLHVFDVAIQIGPPHNPVNN